MSEPIGCLSLLLLLLAVFPLAALGKEPESARVRELRDELAKDPNDSNANYNLGLALMRSIEVPLRKEAGLTDDEARVAQEAEALFKSALALSNHTHGRALVMLGWLYKLRHQYGLAIPYLKDAMKLPPESDDYLKAADVLAACDLALGKDDDALAVVTEALEHHPSDENLLAKKSGLDSKKAAQAIPADERSKKAQQLGEALSKQMQTIMNSADPQAVKQEQMKAAQDEYQRAVQALYKQ